MADLKATAARNRIIQRMNADYATSLSLYLQHFCKLPSRASRTAKLEDISLESMTLRTKDGKSYTIPFHPPISSWADAWARTVDMDREARNTLDTEYFPPSSIFYITVFGLCLFTFVVFILAPDTWFYDTVLRYFPGRPRVFVWLAIALPVVWEAWYLDRSRLRKYGIENGTTLLDSSTMPALKLRGLPRTYESAVNKEANIINQRAYLEATMELYWALWDQRQTIQVLVKHHLRLGNRDSCIVTSRDQWIRGSFNICIPIEVRSNRFYKKLIFRCAMPHKLAETKYPGTVDEKLSSEVGTYIWMQDQCPDIRIPHLYGFGFSDHRHFVHEQQMPFFLHFWRMFQRRFRKLLRYPTLSYYTAHPINQQLPTAYMLLEYIGPNTGQMLSRTWNEHRNDPFRRRNLFRGIAQLNLSLARIPQLEIGSFQFHNNGTITLTNRPLPCSLIILENDGAPRTIQRNETYTCTEPFVADMLKLYENNFLSDPNAVYDAKDCRGQMAVSVLLRMLSHFYVKRERRNGPFYLQLTDFHECNIFVDDDWNITCLIDLEWVCALPAEMLAVPSWLTGHGIDQIKDNLCEFDQVRQEFMNIFEEEEKASKEIPVLASIMHESWKSGAVWFWACLTCPKAMLSVVDDHICPRFSPLSSKAEEIFSQYWCQGSEEVVGRKVTENKEYLKNLEALYSS